MPANFVPTPSLVTDFSVCLEAIKTLPARERYATELQEATSRQALARWQLRTLGTVEQ